MITYNDINKEANAIAFNVSKKYANNEISATELGDRLKYIAEYSKLMKRALKHMQDLEIRL